MNIRSCYFRQRRVGYQTSSDLMDALIKKNMMVITYNEGKPYNIWPLFNNSFNYKPTVELLAVNLNI